MSRRMMVVLFVLGTVLLGAAGSRAGEAGNPLESLPPVVVRTMPVQGAVGVDPGLKEIRVTFSRRMSRRSWSWVSVDPDAWPPVTGRPRFVDGGRTCVLPVSLEPGREYAVLVNSDRYRGFRDRAGRPAVPFLLRFRTAKAKGR